jgi:hypothetical protein
MASAFHQQIDGGNQSTPSHLQVISSTQQESQPSVLSYLKYAEVTVLYLHSDEVGDLRKPTIPFR